MEREKDFVGEYRKISSKLKKRFLRRPNVSEASDQFNKLGRRLKLDDEPQYAGMCYLAVARCEQSIRNLPGEVEALISAARNFLKAEQSLKDIRSPSFENHLIAAIHSYSHAIRILEENGQTTKAYGLCLELGNALRNMGKIGEALTFYQKAADLRSNSTLEYVHSREKVASCFIETGDYHNAVSVLTEISNLAEEHGTKKPIVYIYIEILARSEITRVLLLLLIQPTPHNLSPHLSSILEKYAWDLTEDSILTTTTTTASSTTTTTTTTTTKKAKDEGEGVRPPMTYLSEEVFLLLQSVVMAVQVRDGKALVELEDYLSQHLDFQQRELLRELVSREGKNIHNY